MYSKKVDNLRKRIGRTIQKRGLINENDRVMIGLSGGKDSFVLLDSLADRKKYIPFNFDIVAVHVHFDNVGYQANGAYLQQICDERKVPFYLINKSLLKQENTEKSMCFYCSWHRRKTMFKLCADYNCNKLAFGHHTDDAVETMLLNQMYHASISSMPYRLSMLNNRIQLIRPLLDLRNAELKKYAGELNYQQQLKNCPYINTKRESVRKLLQQMENINPRAVKNIFRSGNKVFNDYLPQK